MQRDVEATRREFTALQADLADRGSVTDPGGIGAADVPRYLAHPAVLAVGGSWLVAPKLVAAGGWGQVTWLAAAAVAAVDLARAGVT